MSKEKRYTEEDLRKAWNDGYMSGHSDGVLYDMPERKNPNQTFDDFITSLSPAEPAVKEQEGLPANPEGGEKTEEICTHQNPDTWIDEDGDRRCVKCQLIVDPQPQPKETAELTDEQCNEFRRLPCSFNDMVRAIYKEGQKNNSQPFKGFWERLKMFVEDVRVNDLPGKEEKEMILNVCNQFLPPSNEERNKLLPKKDR